MEQWINLKKLGNMELGGGKDIKIWDNEWTWGSWDIIGVEFTKNLNVDIAWNWGSWRNGM